MNQLRKAFETEVEESITIAGIGPANVTALLNAFQIEQRRRRRAQLAFLVMTVLAIVIAVAAFVTRTCTSSAVQASITSPTDRAATGRQIDLRGSIHGELGLTELLVVVERDGLMWPKEAEIRIDGDQWRAIVFDHGITSGTFKVSLWQAPPRAMEHVRDWIRQSQATDIYPGMEGLAGAIWLDAVNIETQ